MQIESIRLKNFKSFKNATMPDIPSYCVVVGANGSGKSTLFDVFGFLKDCLTHDVRQALQVRGGFSEVASRGVAADSLIEIEIKLRMEIAAVDFEGNDVAPLSARESRSRASARLRRRWLR